MAQETVAVLDSHQKRLKDKVCFQREELSSVRVESANLWADLDAMTALVQRMKDDIGKSLSKLSTELLKTYEDMVEMVKMKIQPDLVGE